MRRREFITLLGGAAAAWPRAALAQQPAIPVVGFLHSASALAYAVAEFRRGLKSKATSKAKASVLNTGGAREGRYDRLPADCAG